MELKSKIETYISDIKQENRTTEEVYNNRLMVCETCDKLINGVCGVCGCFVLVRAAMLNQSCSNPKKDLWNS